MDVDLFYSDDGTPSYCFIDSEKIKEINKDSIEKGFNRTLSPDYTNAFDDKHLCLVSFRMIQKDLSCSPHYVIGFYAYVHKNPTLLFLDLPIKSFNESVQYYPIEE